MDFCWPAVFSPIHGLPASANVVRIVNPSDWYRKFRFRPRISTSARKSMSRARLTDTNYALQHSLDTYAAGLAKLAGH